MDPSDRERVLQLTADVADVGGEFVAEVDKLVPIVHRLADLVAAQRALDGRLGRHHYGPNALELAASVVLGRLAVLRPALPFESSAAADAAAALLCRDRQLELTREPLAAEETGPSW